MHASGGKDVEADDGEPGRHLREEGSWEEEKWKPLPRPPPRALLSGDGGGSESGSSREGSGEVRIVSALGPSFERWADANV